MSAGATTNDTGHVTAFRPRCTSARTRRTRRTSRSPGSASWSACSLRRKLCAQTGSAPRLADVDEKRTRAPRSGDSGHLALRARRQRARPSVDAWTIVAASRHSTTTASSSATSTILPSSPASKSGSPTSGTPLPMTGSPEYVTRSPTFRFMSPSATDVGGCGFHVGGDDIGGCRRAVSGHDHRHQNCSRQRGASGAHEPALADGREGAAGPARGHASLPDRRSRRPQIAPSCPGAPRRQHDCALTHGDNPGHRGRDASDRRAWSRAAAGAFGPGGRASPANGSSHRPRPIRRGRQRRATEPGGARASCQPKRRPQRSRRRGPQRRANRPAHRRRAHNARPNAPDHRERHVQRSPQVHQHRVHQQPLVQQPLGAQQPTGTIAPVATTSASRVCIGCERRSQRRRRDG